jgi:multidrug efflux pump subunit AcrA (membrane-fusion protein)
VQLGGDTPQPSFQPVSSNAAAAAGFCRERGRTVGRTAGVRIGRRTAGQLEILGGLRTGEQVIVSDYTGLDKIDRIILTR